MILTEKMVKEMSKLERQIKLDELEDLMCNTDYRTLEGGFIYEQYAKSANLIINKQNGEF